MRAFLIKKNHSRFLNFSFGEQNVEQHVQWEATEWIFSKEVIVLAVSPFSAHYIQLISNSWINIFFQFFNVDWTRTADSGSK